MHMPWRMSNVSDREGVSVRILTRCHGFGGLPLCKVADHQQTKHTRMRGRRRGACDSGGGVGSVVRGCKAREAVTAEDANVLATMAVWREERRCCS